MKIPQVPLSQFSINVIPDDEISAVAYIFCNNCTKPILGLEDYEMVSTIVNRQQTYTMTMNLQEVMSPIMNHQCGYGKDD